MMKRVLVFIAVLLAGLCFLAEPARAQVRPDNFEVMLVVDTSGSMRAAMDQAKAAAVGFIDQMAPSVRIGLVHFGNQVGLRQIQFVEGPVEKDALRVQHRPHGAVAHEDALRECVEKWLHSG